MKDAKPVKEPSAAELCGRFKLSDDARSHLRPEQNANQFCEVLQQNKLFVDALRLRAHQLPPLEAIWWGGLCLWETSRLSPTPAITEVLQAVVGWLREPTDASRRGLANVGRTAGMGTPAGSLALAGFFSGGSVAPVGGPEIAPKPGMAARLVASAVLAVARRASAADRPARQMQFLGIAVEVLQGKTTPKRPV